MISETEPGRIWFEGDVGPFDVPERASDLTRPDGRVIQNPAPLTSLFAAITHPDFE